MRPLPSLPLQNHILFLAFFGLQLLQGSKIDRKPQNLFAKSCKFSKEKTLCNGRKKG